VAHRRSTWLLLTALVAIVVGSVVLLPPEGIVSTGQAHGGRVGGTLNEERTSSAGTVSTRNQIDQADITAAPAPTAPAEALGPQPASTTVAGPTPSSRPEPMGQLSVAAFGATAGDTTDDTAAIRTAFTAAARTNSVLTFHSGLYRIQGTLNIPNDLTDIHLSPNTVLRQFGDPRFGTLSKRGSLGARYNMSPAPQGTRSVTLSDVSGLHVGAWLLLVSDDSFNSEKPMNPGSLRRIVGIDGGRVTLDLPLHRSMSQTPRAHAVNMAAPVRITGGVIEHNSPLANFYPAVTLHYTLDPVIQMEIRNHGADGVQPNGTVGGHLDLRVHDLIDDHDGTRFGGGRHYGYGVSATGPTRDLVVSGECWAVRHCFTTNAAYLVTDPVVRGYGDPENIRVSMDTRDTTSTALDTHEPGWNISFSGSTVTNPGRYRAAGSESGKEGGGGVFVRARATHVENVIIIGAMDSAITVAANAPGAGSWLGNERPVIRNVEILEGRGKSGIMAFQPVIIGPGTHIESRHQVVGIHFTGLSHGSSVNGASISLNDPSRGIGVLNAAFAVIADVSYKGVASPTVR
jgi:hypothetical protein